MNISLFIARRLQLKGSKRDTSSSSTIIAVTGVAIAIAVMVITLCVVYGFKNQINEKVIGFDSQITINPANDYFTGNTDYAITLTDSLSQIITSALGGDSSKATIAISLKQPGILKTDDNFAGLIFKGINNQNDLSFLKKNIVEGELPNLGVDSCKNKIGRAHV